MPRKHQSHDEFVDVDLEANYHRQPPQPSKPSLPQHTHPIELTTLPTHHKHGHAHSKKTSHKKCDNKSHKPSHPHPAPSTPWVHPSLRPSPPSFLTRLHHTLRPRLSPSTASTLASLAILAAIFLSVIIAGGLLVKHAGSPMPGEAILWMGALVALKMWVGVWFLVRRLRGSEGEGIEEVSWEEVRALEEERRERVEEVGEWKRVERRRGRRRDGKRGERVRTEETRDFECDVGVGESSKAVEGEKDCEPISKHIRWA